MGQKDTSVATTFYAHTPRHLGVASLDDHSGKPAAKKALRGQKKMPQPQRRPDSKEKKKSSQKLGQKTAWSLGEQKKCHCHNLDGFLFGGKNAAPSLRALVGREWGRIGGPGRLLGKHDVREVNFVLKHSGCDEGWGGMRRIETLYWNIFTSFFVSSPKKKSIFLSKLAGQKLGCFTKHPFRFVV